jgi:hypothetical protein
MVQQFDEPHANPSDPRGQSPAVSRERCGPDPRQNFMTLAQARGWPSNYDAHPVRRVDEDEGESRDKRNKKLGLRMQSPASHQPRSPDLRCKCVQL